MRRILGQLLDVGPTEEEKVHLFADIIFICIAINLTAVWLTFLVATDFRGHAAGLVVVGVVLIAVWRIGHVLTSPPSGAIEFTRCVAFP